MDSDFATDSTSSGLATPEEREPVLVKCELLDGFVLNPQSSCEAVRGNSNLDKCREQLTPRLRFRVSWREPVLPRCDR